MKPALAAGSPTAADAELASASCVVVQAPAGKDVLVKITIPYKADSTETVKVGKAAYSEAGSALS